MGGNHNHPFPKGEISHNDLDGTMIKDPFSFFIDTFFFAFFYTRLYKLFYCH